MNTIEIIQALDSLCYTQSAALDRGDAATVKSCGLAARAIMALAQDGPAWTTAAANAAVCCIVRAGTRLGDLAA